MQKIAKEIKPEDIIEIILRRRWWIIIPFILSIVIGICLAFMLPKMYKAIEQSGIALQIFEFDFL